METNFLPFANAYIHFTCVLNFSIYVSLTSLNLFLPHISWHSHTCDILYFFYIPFISAAFSYMCFILLQFFMDYISFLNSSVTLLELCLIFRVLLSLLGRLSLFSFRIVKNFVCASEYQLAQWAMHIAGVCLQNFLGFSLLYQLKFLLDFMVSSLSIIFIISFLFCICAYCFSFL